MENDPFIDDFPSDKPTPGIFLPNSLGLEGFQSHGGISSEHRMVYFTENPKIKWMFFLEYPYDLGNLQIGKS